MPYMYPDTFVLSTQTKMFLSLIIVTFVTAGARDALGSRISPLPIASDSDGGYMDPTVPPLLPGRNPECSVVVIRHDFVDTISVSADYVPPRGCPFPWSHVVLELSASVSRTAADGIAAVSVAGAEILRTSTPYPVSSGIRWSVRKDITKYAALLRGSHENDTTLSVTFDDDDVAAGIYRVNVSLHFYQDTAVRKIYKGFYDDPADMITPLSSSVWFKIANETDLRVSAVRIPKNTYRALLEIYVSHHADDECWYANPLKSTNISTKANGAFRQVAVSIDEQYVGGVVPFPVVHPGSINPFFWAPVAATGAYDHPSYDMDLTPFLQFLLDSRRHEFGLTVRYGRPYWLVSANLHLWLDTGVNVVTAGMIRYTAPPLKLNRNAQWNDHDHDGKSYIKGKVIERFSGWVGSSRGNITTRIKQKLKFKSQVEIKAKGTVKVVTMKVKSKTKFQTGGNGTDGVRTVLVRRDTPLSIHTTRSKKEEETEFEETTRMMHQLAETRKVETEHVAVSAVSYRQDSEGSVTASGGKGDTKSVYKFRDNRGCYMRTLIAESGELKDDAEAASCTLVGDPVILTTTTNDH